MCGECGGGGAAVPECADGGHAGWEGRAGD